MKRLDLHKIDDLNMWKNATITKFNCYWQVWQENDNSQELFRDLTNAVKYLLNKGYFINEQEDLCIYYIQKMMFGEMKKTAMM